MYACRHIYRIIHEAHPSKPDGDITAELRAHLESCPDCAREYGDHMAFLCLLGERRRPEPTEDEWAKWDLRLERGLDSLENESADRNIVEKPRRIIRWRRIVSYVLAAAAVFLLGTTSGWYFFGRSVPVEIARTRPDPQTAAVTTDALRFLDRSKVVLLGVTMADPETEFTPDYNRLRVISRELLRESPALRERLDASNQPRLAALLDELDMILVQIANFDERRGIEDTEIIRAGAERKGILFRIGLENIVADGGNASPPNENGKL